uniref:Bestrophin homolog n=1 Tax=Angiostrongylus cantonensis TaxID=6313 RepID=A0A0K0DBE6_ANGCA
MMMRYLQNSDPRPGRTMISIFGDSGVTHCTTSSRPAFLSASLFARRHYVFDTNHRACDQSITDIVPNIETLVQRRFDVETLIHRLKENSNLLFEEKLRERRNEGCAWSRIIGIAYSYSLLILALKTQISILAADVCSQFERPQSHSCSTLSVDTSIFMECIQYFMVTGEHFSLEIDSYRCWILRSILDWLLHSLMKMYSFFFSFFFTYISILHLLFQRNSKDGVMNLLTGLVNSIESKKFRETLSSLVDFYLTAAVHVSEAPTFVYDLSSFFHGRL